MAVSDTPRLRRRPTVPPGLSVEHSSATVWGRRALVVALVVVVVAGAAGLLGVRTGEVAARDGSLAVRLDYARVVRPGLGMPWTLTVERPGGFTQPIEVAISASYLRALDVNQVVPEPESQTSRGDAVVWSFAPPPGDTLEVSIDAALEPGVQWRRRATTRVTTAGADAEVRYTTWVLP